MMATIKLLIQLIIAGLFITFAAGISYLSLTHAKTLSPGSQVNALYCLSVFVALFLWASKMKFWKTLLATMAIAIAILIYHGYVYEHSRDKTLQHLSISSDN